MVPVSAFGLRGAQSGGLERDPQPMENEMSRLDIFINRMVSQRACLNAAAEQTAKMPGPVFELGLGNGRTYHHMVEIMAGRDIYVF